MSLQVCLWWGSRSSLLSPYLAQIVLCKAKFTCSGHCRTGVEPKLFFLVRLCAKVEEDPVEGCGLTCALLISTGVDFKGSGGACSFFLPVLARVWAPYIGEECYDKI